MRRVLVPLSALLIVMLGGARGVLARQTVLFEDTFSIAGTQLNLNAWTTEMGPSSYLGRTQLADWVTPGGVGQFVVGPGGAQLALNTFNPTGFSLYGTHGRTIAWFQPTASAGITLTARLQLTSLQRGQVYGVYLFGCVGGSTCAQHHDEIDVELVTNLLQPGETPRVQLNRYADEPLGAGHGLIVDLPGDFDPLVVHEWTIVWSPTMIQYLVDGTVLSSVTTFVPQGAMQANVNVWAPAVDWAAAYDSSLQPVGDAGQNLRYVALVSRVSVVSTAPPPRPPADMDGDLKSDWTVYRRGTGIWFSALSGGGARATQWGVATDIDVAADYDGDGKADVAVWRPSTGQWYIIQSASSTVRVETWGANGDIPRPGDVDGDGRADLVVWRPAGGVWYARLSTGGVRVTVWGELGDISLLADLDGDGRMDFVMFRPLTGQWYGQLAVGGARVFNWGAPGDVPAAGDWDGDGKADVAIFRPDAGQWWIAPSSGGAARIVTWGVAGDVPINGDRDGDGRSDFMVWRPATGVWYTLFSGGGVAAVQWGDASDRAVGREPGL